MDAISNYTMMQYRLHILRYIDMQSILIALLVIVGIYLHYITRRNGRP